MVMGVRLYGVDATAVELTAEQAAGLPAAAPLNPGRCAGARSWITCPVPVLLGLPLALQQLAPTNFNTRVKFEQPAVFLLIDPKSGFAPPWVQLDGLGEVLLARTDGVDFTVPELWEVQQYLDHLINRYKDWLADGPDTARATAERAAALSPAAWARFKEEEGGVVHLEEEEEEDEK
ncbi:hypothetical protein HT031_004852 [Scenedesmus sp. PABB004]|nr:hypothetical protein HT031_004852 [Scenedesmus sp. PABB004]